MSNEEINDKRNAVGDIAYYVRRNPCGVPYVDFGTVVENYPDTVTLQKYEERDTRTIEGIPVSEVALPSKWRKLPKGYAWNTVLFTFDRENLPIEDIDIKNPESLRDAIARRLLVKVCENSHVDIGSEISTKGWRLCRRITCSSSCLEHEPNYVNLYFKDVFQTYEQAFLRVQRFQEQIDRISNMTEEEYVKDLVEQDLTKLSTLYHVCSEKIFFYRRYIFSLSNFINVETRITSGRIEWKYCNNKVWKAIEGDAFESFCFQERERRKKDIETLKKAKAETAISAQQEPEEQMLF